MMWNNLFVTMMSKKRVQLLIPYILVCLRPYRDLVSLHTRFGLEGMTLGGITMYISSCSSPCKNESLTSGWRKYHLLIDERATTSLNIVSSVTSE